jgi:hypothetical protein
MTGVLTLVALTLGLAVAPAAHTTLADEQTPIVLGKKHLLRYGTGWGTAHPHVIFNGGVPNGKAWDLRWRGWGTASARARGLTWLYKPKGGYYGTPGAIELRAYRIGRCTSRGPLAYTRLQVREAIKPGGPLGRWQPWGDWHDICHSP